MLLKQIVCLANSKKRSNRCVAGKEVLGTQIGGWIRPVSKHTPTGELPLEEISFEDDDVPQILDIVTVPLLEPAPHIYQTENYYVDPEYYWMKDDVYPTVELARLCDMPTTLWQNGYHSNNGYNDRIPLGKTDLHVSSSLFLIKPDKLRFRIADEYNRRRVRADFMYGQRRYRLMVTDPEAEELLLERDNGEYPDDCSDRYLCISLGEPFNDFCYKLVAGVVPAL